MAFEETVQVFFFSSRRRQTRWTGDWSSDVCSSDLEIIHDGAVAATDDLITDVGPAREVLGRHPAAQVTDCTGRTIIPGLVNTHTHLFQTLLKGRSEERRVGKEGRCRGARANEGKAT